MTPWVSTLIVGVVAIALGILWWRSRQQADHSAALLLALTPDPPATVEAAKAWVARREVEHAELWAQVRELESDAAIFDPLMRSLPQPALVLDAENRLLAWNESAMVLMQNGQVPRQGSRARDLLRSFALVDTIHQALNSGEAQQGECEGGPGNLQVFAMQVIPVETAGGRRALVLLTDRSSTSAFRELRREFVTNVTHELKTPLTNIVGATETLLGGAMEDPDFRGRFLEIIQRNADQLRALIEDLLLIARSEEEAAPIEVGDECEYRSVREMVLQDLATPAEVAEVSLKAQPLTGGISLLISTADCYTILKNLTENAIRYNKPGGVVEYSERVLEDRIEISIRDTGIGIPPSDLPRVFERFYRADKQRSRAIGGTGLGLAIVKNLAERYGGGVDVMSKPGLGSTFVVTIPLATSVATPILSVAAE